MTAYSDSPVDTYFCSVLRLDVVLSETLALSLVVFHIFSSPPWSYRVGNQTTSQGTQREGRQIVDHISCQQQQQTNAIIIDWLPMKVQLCHYSKKMDATVLSSFQFGNKEVQVKDDGIYIYSTQKNILLSYNRLVYCFFYVSHAMVLICHRVPQWPNRRDQRLRSQQCRLTI